MKYKNRHIIKTSTFNKTPEFVSKYFLKFSGECLETINNFVEILKEEPQNRKNTEIQKVLPYLESLSYFHEFLSLRENKESYIKLLNEFAWILCYKKYLKNTIIKRAKENSDIYYLILYGTVVVLDLVLNKECLTEEQYILHLVKMKLIHEEEIVKQCIEYNKDLLYINTTDIEKYCNSGYKFKYNNLKNEALKDLYNHNFNIQNLENEVPNLEEYIKITKVQNDVKKKNENNVGKKYFYIPHYEKIGIMKSGRYFGDFCIKNLNKERLTYLAIEDTDIGFIDKLQFDRPKLFLPIEIKKEKYIEKYINSFFIFKDVNSKIFSEEYGKYLVYRKYTKNEKLFFQNSIYDGVYLLINGQIIIYTDRLMNEISGLIVSLQYCLDSFSEFLSSLKNEGNENDKNDFIKNPIYHTKEYTEMSKGIKRIFLNKIEGREVIGLNECYNFNNQLMNFNIEVISSEATIIFIPKNIFYRIITSDLNVMESLKNMVELRSRLYMGKLKNYKDSLITEINNMILTNKNKRKSYSEINKSNRNKKIIIKKNIQNLLNNSNENLNQTTKFNITHSTNFNITSSNFNKTHSTNFNITSSNFIDKNFSPNNSKNNLNPFGSNNFNKTERNYYLNTDNPIFSSKYNEKCLFNKFNSFKTQRKYLSRINQNKNILKKKIKISSKAFMSGFPFLIGRQKEEENNINYNFPKIIK